MVVVRAVAAKKRVGRASLQPMLENDHRPPLARSASLRQQQRPVREDVGEDVECDLIPDPTVTLPSGPRPRVRLGERFVKPTDNVFAEPLTVRLDGLPKLIQIRPIKVVEVFRADKLALSPNGLVVAVHLGKLDVPSSLLSGSPIGLAFANF